MLENINLEYLKIFYEVAKCKNLSKAAESLFISQPAVTQTIHKLERAFNITLFIRTKKGVVLTQSGKEIFEKVNDMFLELNMLEDFIRKNSSLETAKLAIGGNRTITKKLLKEPIKNFLLDYPNIEISHITDIQKNLIEKLNIGELDLVITQKIDNLEKTLIWQPILIDKFLMVTTKEYLKIKKEKERYILQGKSTYTLNTFIESNKNMSSNAIYVSGASFALELCLANVGIALLPKYIVEKYLKDQTLEIVPFDLKEEMIYGFYTNPKNISNTLSKFLEYCKY